jgi:hypothetical protein
MVEGRRAFGWQAMSGRAAFSSGYDTKKFDRLDLKA